MALLCSFDQQALKSAQEAARKSQEDAYQRGLAAGKSQALSTAAAPSATSTANEVRDSVFCLSGSFLSQL